MTQVNTVLLPVFEKDVKKILGAKVIVLVRKKKWKIVLFVEFQNINRCSSNANYPLSKMDQILHRVVGAQKISLIGWFSSYNHISFHEDDKEKTTFVTP